MAPYPLRGRAAQLQGRRSECAVLDQLIEAVRAGESRALVVRGEPGMGKTALLDYLAGHAPGCRVVRAAGVQSEMELAFAGLHQLCAPMLDRLDRLPGPQRDALRTAFGISAGPAPDRFLIGLAVLSLLSEVAGERPLVCLVDDQQWLDRASAQVLGVRGPPAGGRFGRPGLRGPRSGDELAGLPELVGGGPAGRRRAGAAGLGTGRAAGRAGAGPDRRRDARQSAGVAGAAAGADSGGAGGRIRVARRGRCSGRIEESFRRQLDALPDETRRLLQLAAADPAGDPLLVWRAAERLGIGAEAATPAAEAGLIEFGAQVGSGIRWCARRPTGRPRFRTGRRCTARWRRSPIRRLDPDRRAWHRAQAAPGPDEDVAGGAGAFGRPGAGPRGLAAAAAFLERAALLTPDPAAGRSGCSRRRRPSATPARWTRHWGCWSRSRPGRADALRAAEVEHLRGQIALDQRRGSDAARLLLSAARRLEPLNAGLARETHLEALWEAAIWASDLDTPGGVREAAEAARAAPPGPDPPRVVDVLLDAFALRLTEGYAAAAPALTRALELVLALDVGTERAGRWLWLAGGRISQIIALELWDFESWHALAARQVQFARGAGALVHCSSRSTTWPGPTFSPASWPRRR